MAGERIRIEQTSSGATPNGPWSEPVTRLLDLLKEPHDWAVYDRGLDHESYRSRFGRVRVVEAVVVEPGADTGPSWKAKPDAEGWWLRRRHYESTEAEPARDHNMWFGVIYHHGTFYEGECASVRIQEAPSVRWFGPVTIPEDK